jgi:hypothetical protein
MDETDRSAAVGVARMREHAALLEVLHEAREAVRVIRRGFGKDFALPYQQHLDSLEYAIATYELCELARRRAEVG